MLAFFGLTHLLIEVKYDLVRLIQHFLDKMNGTGKFKLDVERGEDVSMMPASISVENYVLLALIWPCSSCEFQ